MLKRSVFKCVMLFLHCSLWAESNADDFGNPVSKIDRAIRFRAIESEISENGRSGTEWLCEFEISPSGNRRTIFLRVIQGKKIAFGDAGKQIGVSISSSVRREIDVNQNGLIVALNFKIPVEADELEFLKKVRYLVNGEFNRVEDGVLFKYWDNSPVIKWINADRLAAKGSTKSQFLGVRGVAKLLINKTDRWIESYEQEYVWDSGMRTTFKINRY